LPILRDSYSGWLHRIRAVATGCSAASIVCAILCVASPAHADLDFQVSGTAGVSWLRSMPALKSPETLTSARQVPDGKLPSGGSIFALGGAFDMGVSVDDRWIVPVLGFAGYGAIGSYDTVVTSIDGSIARVHPWTSYQVDVLLPGIGYRVKRRRFMFAATIRSGFSYFGASGVVSGGALSTPFSASDFSPLVQAELEACRRLDPLTRVCLHVAPRIYDFGFLNGATFGLRVEWGR